MQTLEVIIESCGTKAKEVNPHGCYGGNKPHPMDFDDREEFRDRLSKFEEYQSKLRTFDIEMGQINPFKAENFSYGEFGAIKGFSPGKKFNAEILETGKIKIMD